MSSKCHFTGWKQIVWGRLRWSFINLSTIETSILMLKYNKPCKWHWKGCLKHQLCQNINLNKGDWPKRPTSFSAILCLICFHNILYLYFKKFIAKECLKKYIYNFCFFIFLLNLPCGLARPCIDIFRIDLNSTFCKL